LFICTGITPSVAVDNINISFMLISDKTVIIVDDEGDGDYSSIKEALNHADPGDTIEVYSGTYYEHGIIISDDNITLKGIPYELGNGSDKGKPLIDGQGMDLVIGYVSTTRVTIDGFHIENKGGTEDIIGMNKASKCTISNNDIHNTGMALIYVRNSTNIQIVNNNISHSDIRQGILFVDGSANNIISGNVISDVEIGIDLWDSNHNTITGNKIRICSRFGIDIAGGDYNTVKGNLFEDNTVGAHIYISRFNTIGSNTFEDNNVGVYIDKSLGSRIKNNNFFNNQWHAYIEYGLFVYGITNRWNGNYWNESRSTPYPIMGTYIFSPCVQFDWRPARQPYDIEGVI
jgi:parallel beta-helix repeat protein